MKKSLFRPEVSEKNGENWLGEIRLASPISHRIWAIGALIVALIIVAWLCFGEYTRRERVQGILVPVGGFARLKSRGAGEVSKIHAQEGEAVKKGQILLEINNDRYVASGLGVAEDVSVTIDQEKTTLRGDIVNARRSTESRRDDLRLQIALIRQQMAQNREMLVILREEARAQDELLERIKPALEEGYVSATQVQQQRSSALSANAAVTRQLAEKIVLEQQLRDAEGKMVQTGHEMDGKINDSLRQLARTNAAYDKNEAERKTIIKSPVDGVVSSILVYPGQTVGSGSSLATVVPKDAPLEAELLVATSAVGFVRPGSTVAVHYQAFPFQKFGVHRGKVKSISMNALSPAEITELTGLNSATEPMYRVRASLHEQTIQVYGRERKLTAGMAISGGIMLDKRRIYEWLFEPLYTLRKKMEEES